MGLGETEEEAIIVVVPSSAENAIGMFTDSSPKIILAIRDLTLEIRENDKFLRKTAKNDFCLLKPKSYTSDNHVQWNFLRSLDETIELDERSVKLLDGGEPSRDSLIEITGKIYAMLSGE